MPHVPQQIRGICSPDRRSSNRPLPNALCSSTSPGCCAVTSPMMAGLGAAGCVGEDLQCLLSRIRRDDGHQSAFVGHVERIQSQQFAGAADLRHDRNGRLRGGPCRREMWSAISISAAASPPRVRSRRQCRSAPSAVKWPTRSASDAQSLSGAPSKLQTFPLRHDGDAVSADVAADQDLVADR